MQCHLATVWPKLVVASVFCLSAVLSTVTAQVGTPPAKTEPGDVTPVKKATVTTSNDKFEPGNLQFEVEIDLKQVVMPQGPRTGEKSTLSGGKLSRVLKLESAQFENWQSKYAASVKKTSDEGKKLVGSKGREILQFTPLAVRPPLPVLERGREQEVYPFEGLPPLNPEEEAKIVDQCIMITDLKVVNDPTKTTAKGPWTFGFLMEQIANQAETNLSPGKFVRDWLRHWEVDQTINGFTVPHRAEKIQQLIIDPWPKLPTGELDLAKAPFRLLAIGSRLDLRSNKVLGFERLGGGGAGEARFVFCAVNLNDKDENGQPKPLPFTVIFEYAIKREDYSAVRDWALQWYNLKDHQLGTPAYNNALKAITDQFTLANADAESTPNRSALNQLRTNEIALALPWELREFRVDINTGDLKQATVKQNPDNDTFNGFEDPQGGILPGPKAAVLAEFINTRQDDIKGMRHRTPVRFPTGQNFLAAAAPTPPNVFWKAKGIKDQEARHLFSLGTCTACHGREAFPSVGPGTGQDFDQVDNPKLADRQPPHFTHVRPRLADKKAQFSAFLSGKDSQGNKYFLADPDGQIDPQTNKVKMRSFGDLPARATDLKGIVEYGSYYELFRRPTQKVH